MEPLLVSVRRGGVVESTHRVHAVSLKDGRVVASAGDPGLVTFMRSAAKPLQAQLLARLGDVEADQLAIACASHLARPEQLDPVRRLLARARAAEDDLECGADGQPPSRLKHNCSGKHAGMLAVCSARGWARAGYRLPDHPLQRELLEEVADAAGVSAASLATGVDGCGVVSFALSLERMARAFAALPRRPGGPEIVVAMQAHPELIRGPGAPDTELMRALPGWIAKGGAEGVFCAGGPDGIGLALKAEDGAGRAIRPALAAFADRLGLDLPQAAATPVENSRGEVVGELVAWL